MSARRLTQQERARESLLRVVNLNELSATLISWLEKSRVGIFQAFPTTPWAMGVKNIATQSRMSS